MTYLVQRISSLGYVAMAVPVIASVSRRYPEHRFVVVAQKRLEDMFHGMENVRFVEAGSEEEEAGSGKWEVGSEEWEVINLDDSRWTRLEKEINNIPFVVRQLRHESDRVAEIFRRHGLQTDRDFTALAVNEPARETIMARYGAPKEGEKRIGIAPFAKHRSNMLPYRVTKEVIGHYAAEENTRVFLFGAGKIESEMLRQWADLYPGVESVAGELTLGEELELMRTLGVMICMDSANQHLSSLVGLRAVSIWCATHPATGFYGWKQDEKDRVEIGGLSCRPCTVHGREHCLFRNFACREISMEEICKCVNT